MGGDMAIVRKITIGVAPFAKMFRVSSQGGATVDALLRLRTKNLADDYFEEVGSDAERKNFRIMKSDYSNVVQITEDAITFTKDFYVSGGSYDFGKFIAEFKIVWNAINKTMAVHDIRRIGIVAEYRYEVDANKPSRWLREKLTTLKTQRITEKFHLRFEEREFASDGNAPDPQKSDFINYIYAYYDGAMDGQHVQPGALNATLDVQRYFTPVHNGDVADEVQKIYKHFVAAEKTLDGHLKSLGAANGKK